MFAAVNALGVSRDPVCLCAKTQPRRFPRAGADFNGDKYSANTNTNTVTHSRSPCEWGIGFFIEDT